MRRVRTGAALSALVALLFAGPLIVGASAQAAGATTLTIATASPPPTLDPYFTTTEASLEISIDVFDTLAAYNAKFELKPDLATSWNATNNYTVWHFNLAHGIRFQNGQLMTSADVVASLERYQKVGALNQFMTDVRSIAPAGRYGVTITLKQSDALLVSQLADPLSLIAIMPAKYAKIDTPLSWQDLIGTGPYKYAKVAAGKSVTLTKWTGYTPPNHMSPSGLAGDREGHVQNLVYEYVSSPETRMASLQRGAVQYAESVPYIAYSTIAHNPSLKPAINQYFFDILYQINEYTGLMKNRDMRLGVAEVLNDTAIMNVVTNGQKQFYHLNPSVIYPQESLWWRPYGSNIYNHPNLAAAKALFKKAGYHGQQIVILSNTTYNWMYETTIVTEQELKAAGLNVKLEVTDWPAEVARSSSHTGWNLMITGWSPYTDPGDYSVGLGKNGAVDWGYNNAQMNSLLARGASTPNVKVRQQVYADIQKLFWEDPPEIPIGNLYGLDAYSAHVSGYTPWYLPVFWTVTLH